MSEEVKSDASQTAQMYCVKCRSMVTVTAPKRVVMKSNRHALQGNCPHCSYSTYKIVARN